MQVVLELLLVILEIKVVILYFPQLHLLVVLMAVKLELQAAQVVQVQVAAAVAVVLGTVELQPVEVVTPHQQVQVKEIMVVQMVE